jgi:hypothetical protein
MNPTDPAQWGARNGGDIPFHQLLGWKMMPMMDMALVRLGVEQPRPDNPKAMAALNYALTPDQCREIADALLQMAEHLQAIAGSA